MENETFVPEIDTAVNLPQVNNNPRATPADAAAAVAAASTRLQLEPQAQDRLKNILEPMQAAVITDEVIDLLATALRHDDDVATADATGYLRGRNENIDAALHHVDPEQHPVDDAPAAESNFPRYVRRSIWD